MLTRTGGYALHATLTIAEKGGTQQVVRATEIALALSIPANYLAKILHALTRAGVLVSERGRHGGFRLARPASDITLMEVVEGFDDMGKGRQCLLGRGACSDDHGCRAHEEWLSASAAAYRFFQTRSLADLMNGRR